MFFITGCTGLVGSFIARKLLQQGNHLRALKRKTSDMSLVADIADKIEWIEGDILDITGLEKSIEGADTVIHTAAMVSLSYHDKKLIFKTNVEGTSNIVNVCIKKGVKKLCHLSSVAAIGKPTSLPESEKPRVLGGETESGKTKSKLDNKQIQRSRQFTDSPIHPFTDSVRNSGGEACIDENIQFSGYEKVSLYAQTKYLAEMEVWRGIEEGLNAVILNPAVVLGPGNWKKGSSKIFHYVWKQYPFYTTKVVNYIDVRDLAEITLQLINTGINNERYLIFAGEISYKELFDTIALNFDKRKPNIMVSPFWGGIAWRFEIIRSLFTGKPPLVTKDIVKSSLNSLHYNNGKIRDLLNLSNEKAGLNFRNINDTIKWTCDELKIRYGLEND
ncbi:MAG: NAD-dependent epimerase/dehydratase family protein [Bacteroidetes bacterium]|nr:NAD-dependent epimerase/dehydratase family protein [Bacteroidota bacterium]